MLHPPLKWFLGEGGIVLGLGYSGVSGGCLVHVCYSESTCKLFRIVLFNDESGLIFCKFIASF